MPPLGTHGETLPTQRGVGAHAVHLAPGPLSDAFACTDCHNPPTSTSHATGAVEFSWSGLARGAGTPVFNPTDASCATTYCHGNFTGGNTANAPIWTAAGTGATCGSCHALPPGGGHTTSTACASCHGPGYSLTTVNPATHVDGIVTLTTSTCTSCHGTAGVSPAPPVDTAGQTATSRVSVGAHQAHVAATLSAPLACTECHGAAAATYGTSHSDGTVQVGGAFFGPLANRGTSTVWNGASCAASYCHGGTSALAGGTATTPVWTLVDGSQKGCASCHGFPPPAPHAQRDDCGTCHPGYSKTGPTTGTVAATTHVNGTVEIVGMTCTSCHGTTGVNPAPPADTHANTATTARGVGAHQAHVAATLSAPIACAQCHGAASATYTTGHADGTIQVGGAFFGALANQGTSAVWNGASCAASYCHGGSSALSGGTATAPVWTLVDGSQKGCTSCHGSPPPAPHMQRDDCGTCHPGYSKTGATTGTVVAATHVNGTVDVAALSCTTCHGDANLGAVAGADANVKAAPPVDTHANAATTARGVGVHQAHVNGARSRPVACAECHGSLAAYTASHSDGATPIAFGTLGNASGEAFSTTTLGCASTYCHGNFSGGNGAVATPAWTTAGTLGCTACHGNPPAAPHVQRDDCATCHPGYAKTGAATGTVVAATHVDGHVDLDPNLSCSTCHTSYAMAGTATYHHVMGSDALPTAAYPTNNSPATTALADKNCLQCHVAHDRFGAPGQVMRTAITGTVTATSDDAGLCTSCHANDQQKDQTRQKSDGTTATAGWAASAAAGWGSASGAGGHNYTVPGAFQPSSAAAGAFTVNCVKCHNSSAATTYQSGTAKFSLHESADRRLRAPLGQATAADNNEQTFCFRCHSATTDAIGGTAKGSTPLDWYGAQAMPAKATGLFAQVAKLATGSGHNTGGYAGLHRPNPGEENLAYLAANKHVECSDCHDPHQSRRGDQSVSGTATTAPTTSGLTDAAAAWIPGQWVGYSVDVATTTAATAWVRGHVTANTATTLSYSTLASTPAGLVKYRIGARLNGGAVSAATGTTLTDSQSAVGGAKAWATNAWAGWTVNVVLGVGAGQSFPIASNTATVLTIAGTWATTPTTASRYVISKLPNVMAGATGVNVTGWGTPAMATWTVTDVFSPAAGSTTPLPAASAQWQVCFKCHSAANASLATWKATWSDAAKEFNPNNQSYHPIAAPAASASGTSIGNTQLAAAQLTNGWKPGDVMSCSDCHGNDDTAAAASQGPHASAVAFILRGPNTRWPTQSNGTTRWTTSNYTTGSGTAAGNFCLNCHALSGVHTRGDHAGTACTGCHIVIPHGGKLKRLIRTTNTPAPYFDVAGAATTSSATWTTGQALLKAYAGGSSDGNTSCGANCTTHHNLTANTATNAW
jgi:predicted CxxxxCH...CXXCH cytochrome family protein